MYSNWKDLYSLLLSRIYHEDSLLSQRTYNFVTFNAFLATALALSSQFEPFGYTIILLGWLLSICQIFIGIRTTWAIYFWRTYSELVEKKLGFHFDSKLFKDFYEGGNVKIPLLGSITIKKSKTGERIRNQKIMKAVFPWSYKISDSSIFITPNTLTGIIIPCLISCFWSVILFEFLYYGKLIYSFWPLGLLLLVLPFAFTFFALFIISPEELPGIPEIENSQSGSSSEGEESILRNSEPINLQSPNWMKIAAGGVILSLLIEIVRLRRLMNEQK